MRLRRLEPVLRKAFRGPCAIPRGSTLLIAVSGGADSTALLVGLSRIGREFGLRLRVAHLHHGLRGVEADRDLEFVRGLCARLAMPLSSARWNVALRMRRRGLRGQAGLRTLRREFLIATARRARASAIATGHTADDQLETVVLRLLRGTGLPGLGGMRERSGKWIKPMLEATRADVEADLRRAGITWREDLSNRDLTYTRNRVRNIGIPALIEALAPRQDEVRARPVLARRVARAAREIRDALEALEAGLPGAAQNSPGEEIALDPEPIRTYPVAARRALLRRLWKRTCPNGPGLTYRHLLSLEGLFQSRKGGARVELPSRWRAERKRGRIWLRRDVPGFGLGAIRLPVPGRAEWGGLRFECRWKTPHGAKADRSPMGGVEECFAAEGLLGALELRAGQADERFVPFGRRNPVRLAEFLKKQGVSRDERTRPRVLADQGGILWVIGVRRSARAPITSRTRRALHVHAEPND